MLNLTITLFERLGILLIIAFVMTRTPGFKSLLYRKYSLSMSLVHTLVFGIFGIASTMVGIVIQENVKISHSLILFPVGDDYLVVSMSLVAIVIAGLLGGPLLGFGAGVIAGVHLLFLGGIGAEANALINPLTGLLAGLTARFFSNERVISPFKALFIGVFPPILHMQFLLIFYLDHISMIEIVNTIGLPLILTNSTAIAIFTAMIGIVLREQENEAALASRQALTIAKEAIPFLKNDSELDVAKGLANLLFDRLKLAAVSVANQRTVLVHKGIGEDHHQNGDKINSIGAIRAFETKNLQISYEKSELKCIEKNCLLEAAIFIPIIEDNQVTYLITFYFRKAEHISQVELTMAQGIGQFLSDQLNMVSTEKLKANIRDAELRNLQAQINPHFLFNTLQLIAGLFRENPTNARHITLQLASFMRFNLRLVSKSVVELEKECEHVEAYRDIIRERFKGRLQIYFSKPEDLSNIYIPPATIQPLVENSINHGLKQKIKDAKIEIVIKREKDRLIISVRDNGIGFPEELLAIVGNKPLGSDQNGGTGLYNVNQRLIRLLGESSNLHFRNLNKGGSEVCFSIPISNQTEGVMG
ncbi:LytS/YhcK type 5TM receptor domain-containing protein [Pallidibacillus pasinlerensis]|uniref:histidine kinase n=1 Tax=Pallidibacillus pasinlerensis TaxID=2703818 RepID=A0ABX0A6N5_9BACI|nr:LytS/YhcK type 5TM receptor domain-containing protein [Pallidibacillus pasinlerensis]NCU17080.1 sensor histidine kinase [Pallidibacillus pasinlerensis]